ncbi:hypothetical protein B0A55_06751 [Friedmanniomyces simplex]|uniref:NmrA-like domain-containing protein n=1 Tax=Friedmanniomyces simplex TaxID=329884 RepID=A0A4U0X9K7_9PEZI|nr:hypothetical protein B0A55_06751 [Friedmanniomyces simplex]
MPDGHGDLKQYRTVLDRIAARDCCAILVDFTDTNSLQQGRPARNEGYGHGVQLPETHETRVKRASWPNGTLGPPVITHLLNLGVALTLLTRHPDTTAQHYPPPIQVLQTDYTSVDQLTATLRQAGGDGGSGGVDSLVILINRDELESQIRLIDAAIAAGVPHIVPSSFGIDSSSPEVSALPQIRAKMEMERYLVGKAEAGLVSYTGVNTGLFFDWGLEVPGIPVNLKGGPTFRADGGDVALSVSTLDLIGRAVAQAVLQREEARNRFLYVHSAAVTQNQLLRYAREVAPERVFAVVEVDTEKAVAEAEEKIRQGATGPRVAMPMMMRVSFGLGLGLFKKVDNAFLGLEVMTEEDIKALVAKYVKKEG